VKLWAASKAEEERRAQRMQNPPNQCPSDQSPLNDDGNASTGGRLGDDHHDGTPDTTHGDRGIAHLGRVVVDSNAGKPLGGAIETLWDQLSKQEESGRPYAPFESKEDWELCYWLSMEGVSQGGINRFRKLKWVHEPNIPDK
jgi:hypothetical protein